MHVIYVDVYFAINFLMDFIILVVAKQILNFKGKIEVRTAIRCVIAALFGTGKNTGTQKIKCTNADVWNSNWMSANEGGSLSNAKQTQDPQKSV